MEDLARRIEAAEGPSRELDGEIDRLFHAHPKNGDCDIKEGAIWQVDDGWSGLLVRPDGFARGSFCAPAYTSSIDAAMTLIAADWEWMLDNDTSGNCEPYRCKMGQFITVNAATPALALSAAAIRAAAKGTT